MLGDVDYAQEDEEWECDYQDADFSDDRSFKQIIDESNLTLDKKKKIMEIKSLKDQFLMSSRECRKQISTILSNEPLKLVQQILSKL